MLLFCVTMAVGLLALAVHFGGSRSAVGDSLCGNAYGIYLLHYPIVLWIQYGLLRRAARTGRVKGCWRWPRALP